MAIEPWLLLLESLLLVATIILLLYNIREGQQRDNLLREMGRATKVLTRHEYFFTLVDSMQEAEQEIIGCISGRSPSGDDVRMTRNIIDVIGRMTRKGVRITYILPKLPDRLQIGVEYAKAGAQVLFSSGVMVHDLRYTVIDGRTVVLGIPEHMGEKEATRKGYRIPSEGLALVLKDHFGACERPASLREYVREVIEQTGAATAHLAHEFKVDEADLKRVLEPDRG